MKEETAAQQQIFPNFKVEDYAAVNRRAYEALSVAYELRASLKSKFETPPQVLIDRLISHLDKTLTSSVLEIGPGSGEALAYFNLLGFKTTAVDISPAMAKSAVSKSPHTKFIITNAAEADLPNGRFDIIYACAVIHLFPMTIADGLLEKIAGWLSAKGVVFISTTIHDVPEEGFFFKDDYQRSEIRFRKKWNRAEFQQFIEQRFRIVDAIETSEPDRGKKWIGYVGVKP